MDQKCLLHGFGRSWTVSCGQCKVTPSPQNSWSQAMEMAQFSSKLNHHLFCSGRSVSLVNDLSHNHMTCGREVRRLAVQKQNWLNWSSGFVTSTSPTLWSWTIPNFFGSSSWAQILQRAEFSMGTLQNRRTAPCLEGAGVAAQSGRCTPHRRFQKYWWTLGIFLQNTIFNYQS